MTSIEKTLNDILYDIFEDSTYDEDVGDFRMTIDLVMWCDLDGQNELTELAVTKFPFIAQVIVEEGRPDNHYIITWEVVG